MRSLLSQVRPRQNPRRAGMHAVQPIADRLTEGEVRSVLHRLDPLWDELFPAEQARIVRALVERAVIAPEGAEIRMRIAGLAGLVRDLGAMAPEAREAA